MGEKKETQQENRRSVRRTGSVIRMEKGSSERKKLEERGGREMWSSLQYQRKRVKLPRFRKEIKRKKCTRERVMRGKKEPSEEKSLES